MAPDADESPPTEGLDKYKIQASILAEFQRQFGETTKRSDAVDQKIGTVLGFIFVTIGLLINKDFLTSVFQSPISVIALFAIGLSLVLIAVFSGMWAISFRPSRLGPDTGELYNKFNDKPEDYVKAVIAGRLRADTTENRKIIASKVRFGRVTFATFSLGLIAIVIVEIVCYGKLW